ncbi:MAG: site-specific integrase [Actinobacteria bacterium]|nr:site-specific integrase [Actinomycetota bacterium]
MADSRKLEKTRVAGIYKRENRYVVIERDNRGRQVKRFAETLQEARNVKASLRADVARGEFRPNSQTPFVTYAREWVKTYAGRTSRGLKEQTRKDYEAALARNEFGEHFRGLKVSELEATDLEAYAEVLKRKGLTPRTIRNLILPLRLCLATAHQRRHIRFNPFAGVKVAAAMGTGAREDDARALTQAEIVTLLTSFDRAAKVKGLTAAELHHVKQTRLLTLFLLQTGCRIGEALALTWGDFEDGLTSVRIRRRTYKGTTDKPKSKYGERSVPVSPLVRKQLRAHRGSAAKATHLFLNSDGKPLDYSAAHRVFRPVADAAGLKWATFHTCRHTCASWLFRAREKGGLGASAPQVQKWLGHHSPSFTLERYVHLVPSDLPTADGFDRLLGATPGATRPTEHRRGRRAASTAEVAA